MSTDSEDDTDSKDYFDQTDFNYAAVENDVVLVKSLLTRGADVNAKNIYGTTALHEVANENEDKSHSEVIKLLLNQGADVNARDRYGSTPFHYLVQECNVEMIQLFLNFKADVNVMDDDGQSLLFAAAAYNKNLEVFQKLIDLGLDANHRDHTGKTPLHLACFLDSNNINVLKFFLKNDANMNLVDLEGFTPIINALLDLSIREPHNNKETIKKSLSFIMEHTDFNILENSDILKFLSDPLDFLLELVLKHFAKLQLMNVPVHPELLESIFVQDKYNVYYKKCTEELLRAKNTRPRNCWITFFNLLVDNRRKLKNYVRNEDLIQDLKKTDFKKDFSIFGVVISENVKKGIKRRELFDKSADLLSDCVPILNPTHLIITDILDRILNKKDLTKFCE